MEWGQQRLCSFLIRTWQAGYTIEQHERETCRAIKAEIHRVKFTNTSMVIQKYTNTRYTIEQHESKTCRAKAEIQKYTEWNSQIQAWKYEKYTNINARIQDIKLSNKEIYNWVARKGNPPRYHSSPRIKCARRASSESSSQDPPSLSHCHKVMQFRQLALAVAQATFDLKNHNWIQLPLYGLDLQSVLCIPIIKDDNCSISHHVFFKDKIYHIIKENIFCGFWSFRVNPQRLFKARHR